MFNLYFQVITIVQYVRIAFDYGVWELWIAVLEYGVFPYLYLKNVAILIKSPKRSGAGQDVKANLGDADIL